MISLKTLIDMEIVKICPECKGESWIREKQPDGSIKSQECQKCDGHGYILNWRVIQKF